jgi:hypothetical protein
MITHVQQELWMIFSHLLDVREWQGLTRDRKLVPVGLP